MLQEEDATLTWINCTEAFALNRPARGPRKWRSGSTGTWPAGQTVLAWHRSPKRTEQSTQENIAQRLRIRRDHHTAWRLARDTAKFSLADAQPKTALLLENGRWDIPSGRIPTTHMLRPRRVASIGMRRTRMPAWRLPVLWACRPPSRVTTFADEIAIAVETTARDQETRASAFTRKTARQALAIMPTRRYRNKGGPAVSTLLELLSAPSSAREEDMASFLGAIDFN
jgi:serine/threonine-protein kinase HipA